MKGINAAVLEELLVVPAMVRGRDMTLSAGMIMPGGTSVTFKSSGRSYWATKPWV